ncbi:GNAT family N-acetyltransferase [Dongia sedimenti]|uniref:GNAT family N-acetyltransferase n=1 Tax=Dongia sedimenti TaxID=3064282 RepID=A0ABU0YTF5_9PROT|nr:GNAT family N-acetyltransferase [Rhodospirillaceae bacterium R-7]
MSVLRPLSALSAEEREWIGGFLGHDGVLPLYFETAIEDLARGIDNRLVLIGRERRGLVLGIVFAGLEAFTILGSLDDAELRATYTRLMPGELHVTAELAAYLRPQLGTRLVAELAMRTETCAIGQRTSDPSCVQMTDADREKLTAFYNTHNPRHVFSPWMLEHPFFAVVEQGEILAAAGVLALSRRLGWALIGNFLTRPDRRGRGLARRVGNTLLAALGRNGIGHAALVTTDDNVAARSVYRDLGFVLAEAGIELDLK